MENPLWMEVLMGESPINGPFSSQPCLMTLEGVGNSWEFNINRLPYDHPLPFPAKGVNLQKSPMWCNFGTAGRLFEVYCKPSSHFGVAPCNRNPPIHTLIYIYIHSHICIYIYINTHISTHIYIYTYIYVWFTFMYTYTYIYIYTYICTWYIVWW